MSKADRRINSATCLPLSGFERKILGGRASLPADSQRARRPALPKAKGPIAQLVRATGS